MGLDLTLILIESPKNHTSLSEKNLQKELSETKYALLHK